MLIELKSHWWLLPVILALALVAALLLAGQDVAAPFLYTDS